MATTYLDCDTGIDGRHFDADFWPCGHPRTAHNTRKVGKAGVRCRECRREVDRKHYAKLKALRAA